MSGNKSSLDVYLGTDCNGSRKFTHLVSQYLTRDKSYQNKNKALLLSDIVQTEQVFTYTEGQQAYLHKFKCATSLLTSA
jgi:hypothetical protein